MKGIPIFGRSCRHLAGAPRLGVLFVLISGLLLAACAGLNYSQRGPEADSFHPRRVVVLPLILGDYEAARDDASAVVVRVLAESGWFEQVTQPDLNAAGSAEVADLSGHLSAYILRLTTAGYSDAQLSGRLGDSLQADALLLCRITAWGYGTEDGDKVARVGMWMKLIEPKSGAVVWTASHECSESFWLMRPALSEVCLELMQRMVKEMPH